MDAAELRRLGRRLARVADDATADTGGDGDGVDVAAAVTAAIRSRDQRVVGEFLAVLDVLAHWMLRVHTTTDGGALPGLDTGFDAAYDGAPPSDIGRSQPVFQRLADDGGITGRVLDVGCGTGEHTLLAAGLGLDAVGIDIAPKAVALARQKAAERGADARFEVLDVADLEDLGETFDTVLDCGLLHTLPEDAIPTFVDALAAVLRPGGTYHVLCVSDASPAARGPAERVGSSSVRRSETAGRSSRSTRPNCRSPSRPGRCTRGTR
jgi:SAM-dependent methyltransferase